MAHKNLLTYSSRLENVPYKYIDTVRYTKILYFIIIILYF